MITLEQAKLHLRVDIDDDDTLITSLIRARQTSPFRAGSRARTAKLSWLFVCGIISLSKDLWRDTPKVMSVERM